jgi:peptide/nickel transport system permease protein
MRQVLTRASWYAIVFLLVVTLNFFLVRLMPGDPLVHLLGEEGYLYLYVHQPQALEEVKAKYGLDKPVVVQYLTYLGKCLRGDFGWSYQYGQPVFKVIIFRLKWTLVLLLPAIALSALLGAWLGSLAGWRRGGKREVLSTLLLLFLYSLPTYCLGMILILLLAYHAGWFPLGGMAGEGKAGLARVGDVLRHLALPLTVLVIHNTAYNYLIMRNAVAQVKTEDFVLTAAAKGLKEKQVLFRHVLPNALPPLINVVALDFGFLLAGALLVEVVFSWQGMGTLIYEAVVSRDYPLLQACFLILTGGVLLANLAADLLCAWVDPRIREGESFA